MLVEVAVEHMGSENREDTFQHFADRTIDDMKDAMCRVGLTRFEIASSRIKYNVAQQYVNRYELDA
ncbi:hypothetical protein M422DRAFT_249348 [Sphaerobolus stellatus SS14]|uniref:Unplaced genomic scaffold SPHSTscaffold_1074, whole genome shotgun sequence n=1 Tax=Sphaerobolus stellatus (strain SS14) TaxID=990650 RepID=A0A0C9VIA9_SPHS4|nr:hypothetical protein M422DRAFT_277027 [Sphaerobolus stellatus SS14]KIJ47041.1 hypothetical protein M422DRAFT_249348 [Sphaerobolus stellatus SS14]